VISSRIHGIGSILARFKGNRRKILSKDLSIIHLFYSFTYSSLLQLTNNSMFSLGTNNLCRRFVAGIRTNRVFAGGDYEIYAADRSIYTDGGSLDGYVWPIGRMNTFFRILFSRVPAGMFGMSGAKTCAILRRFSSGNCKNKAPRIAWIVKDLVRGILEFPGFRNSEIAG
jgi:hypothetical protein